jgi:hydrogenase expression/formation protein HypC
MCLTNAAEVLTVSDGAACVLWKGQQVTVNTTLLESVAPGDRLMIHAGFALEKIDPAEAAAFDELMAEWDVAVAEATAAAQQTILSDAEEPRR